MCESRRQDVPRPGEARARLSGEGLGTRICLLPRLHAPATTRDRRHDVHEGAAIHCDLRNPSRCALERRSSRHGSGLQVHPRRDRGASPTRVAGPASSRSISAGGRREDREGRPASANRRLAHPLLPRASEARAQGPGPRKYLARRDRESPHGRTDRERPVPSLQLGPRGADDLRPEPALLGTAHRLPRPDRPPLLPILPAATYPRPGARGSQAGRFRHGGHA